MEPLRFHRKKCWCLTTDGATNLALIFLTSIIFSVCEIQATIAPTKLWTFLGTMKTCNKLYVCISVLEATHLSTLYSFPLLQGHVLFMCFTKVVPGQNNIKVIHSEDLAFSRRTSGTLIWGFWCPAKNIELFNIGLMLWTLLECKLMYDHKL